MQCWLKRHRNALPSFAPSSLSSSAPSWLDLPSQRKLSGMHFSCSRFQSLIERICNVGDRTFIVLVDHIGLIPSYPRPLIERICNVGCVTFILCLVFHIELIPGYPHPLIERICKLDGNIAEVPSHLSFIIHHVSSIFCSSCWLRASAWLDSYLKW